jgi:hypothetical protein
MHIVAYDASGAIFKTLQGPSLEWAATFIAEDYGEGFLFLKSDHEVDNAKERVNVNVDPPVLALFAPTKTPDEIKAEILAATQRRLDEFAQTRGYDGILSAATYATSAVLNRAAEGKYAVEIRDHTWSALYEMLAAVQAGLRLMPSGYTDIEDDLPALTWPA